MKDLMSARLKSYKNWLGGLLLFGATLVAGVILSLTGGPGSAAFASGPLVTCSTSGSTLTVTFASGSVTSATVPAVLAIDANGNIKVPGCTSLTATVTTYTSVVVKSLDTAAQWFELDSSLFTSTTTLCTPSINLDSSLVTGSGFEESTPASGAILMGDNGTSVVGSLDSSCSSNNTNGADLVASTNVSHFQFNLGTNSNTSSATVSMAGGGSNTWSPVPGTSADFVESSTIGSSTSVTGSSAIPSSTLDLSSSQGTGTLLVNTTSTTPFAFKDTNSTISKTDSPASSTPSVTFAGIKEVIGSNSLANYFIADASNSYNFIGTTTATAGSTLDLSSSSGPGTLLVNTTPTTPFAFNDTNSTISKTDIPTSSTPSVTFAGIKEVIGSNSLANYFIANASNSYNFIGTTTATAGSTLDLSSSSVSAATAQGSGIVVFSTTSGVSVSGSTFASYLVPAGLYFTFATGAPGNFSVICNACTVLSQLTLDGSSSSSMNVTFAIGSDASFILFGSGNIVHFGGVALVIGDASLSNTINVSSIVNGDSYKGSTVGDLLNLQSLATSSANIATVDLSVCSVSGFCTVTNSSGKFSFDLLASPPASPTSQQYGISSLNGPSTGYATYVIPNPIALTVVASGPNNVLDASGGFSGQSFVVQNSNTASVSVNFSNSLNSSVSQAISGIETIKSSALGSAVVTFLNSGTFSSFGNNVLSVVGGGGKNELDLSTLPLPSNQGSSLSLVNGAGTFSSGSLSVSVSGYTIINGPSTGNQYSVTFDAAGTTTCPVVTASVIGCEFAISSNLSSSISYFSVGSLLQVSNPYIDFTSGGADCNFASGTTYSEFCLAYGATGSVNQLLVASGFDNFSNATPTSGGIGVKLPAVPSAISSKTFTLSGSSNFIDGSAAPVQTTVTINSPNLTVSFASPTTTTFTFIGLSSFPISSITGSLNGLTTFVLDPNLTKSINIVGQSCATPSSCVNTISIASFPSLTTVNAASGQITLTSGHSYSFSGIQKFIGSVSGGTTFVGGTASQFGFIFVGQNSSSSSPANTLSYQSYSNGNNIGVRIDLLAGLACSAVNASCTASTSDQFSGITQIVGSQVNDIVVPGQSAFVVNGGGGLDTLDLSQISIQGGARVNLASGSVAYTVTGVAVAETINGFSSVIDSVAGGDSITASNQLTLIDSISGGNTYIAEGGDLVIGGTGTNALDLTHLSTSSVSIDLSNPSPQIVAGHYYTLKPSIIGIVYLPPSAASSTNYVHGGSSGTTTVVISGGNNILTGGSGSFVVQVTAGGSYGTTFEVSGSGLTSALNGTSGTDIYIPASGSLSSVTINPSASGNSTLDFTGSPGAVYIDLSLTNTFQLPSGYLSPSGFSPGTVTSVAANSVTGGYGASVSLNQTSSDQINNVIGSNNSDIIVGSQGANQLAAGVGDSLIVGGGGGDRLTATGGNTTFETGPGSNYVDGGAGNSTIDYSNGSLCPPSSTGNTCAYGPASVNLQSGLASRNGYTVNGQSGTDQIHNIRNIIGSSAVCTQVPGTGSLCDVLEGSYLPGVLEMGYGLLPANDSNNAAFVSGLRSFLRGPNGGAGALCSSVGYTCFNATALIGGASGVATVMVGGFGNGTTFQSNSAGDVVLANSLGDTSTVSSGGATFFVAPSQTLGLFGSAPTPSNPGLAINVFLAQSGTLLESSNELSPADDNQVAVAGL